MKAFRSILPTFLLAALLTLGSWAFIFHGPDMSIAQIGRGPVGSASISLPVSIGDGGTGQTTATLARTGLGLAIGTNVQAFDADTAKLDVAQAWTAAQSFTEVALTDASTITWNWSTQQRASVTLTDNRTLGNPTADTFPAGRMATLRVIQDGGGSNTLAYSSSYDFVGGSAPTLTTAGAAIDFLSCYSDGTNILCTISLDMK